MAVHPLFMVQVDIATAAEAEWNTWYDSIHLPEILTVPGFLSGHRYRAVEGTPKYMTLYELTDATVLKSEAFARARGWRQFSPYVTAPILRVYEPIHPNDGTIRR